MVIRIRALHSYTSLAGGRIDGCVAQCIAVMYIGNNGDYIDRSIVIEINWTVSDPNNSINFVKHAYIDSTDNACIICNVHSTLARV